MHIGGTYTCFCTHVTLYAMSVQARTNLSGICKCSIEFLAPLRSNMLKSNLPGTFLDSSRCRENIPCTYPHGWAVCAKQRRHFGAWYAYQKQFWLLSLILSIFIFQFQFTLLYLISNKPFIINKLKNIQKLQIKHKKMQ